MLPIRLTVGLPSQSTTELTKVVNHITKVPDVRCQHILRRAIHANGKCHLAVLRNALSWTRTQRASRRRVRVLKVAVAPIKGISNERIRWRTRAIRHRKT